MTKVLKMSQKIIILKPRLDVPFKNLGPIPKKRGTIVPIRRYWGNFVDIIISKHVKNKDKVQIIEKPLWQFDKDFVLKLDFDKIYIPHRCIKTFDKNLEIENIYYYMQMVFPWLFQVDKSGWCASASVWPIQPQKDTDSKTFKLYQNLVLEGKSKFDQPKRQKITFKKKYLLFPCQIPHDLTIKLHSKISVAQGLVNTIKIARALNLQLVVKPHPVNMEAMEPLAKIVAKHIDKGHDILWGRDVNIHDLLEKCEAVFTINSGVGMEALLHNKPVFCFGKADYAAVSHFIKNEINWEKRYEYISKYPAFLDSYVKNMIDVG